MLILGGEEGRRGGGEEGRRGGGEEGRRGGGEEGRRYLIFEHAQLVFDTPILLVHLSDESIRWHPVGLRGALLLYKLIRKRKGKTREAEEMKTKEEAKKRRGGERQGKEEYLFLDISTYLYYRCVIF